MMMMEGGRLTPEQIATVLRRAAVLDRGEAEDDRLDAGAVEAAAIEAGFSPPAVSRALAELRIGALEPVDRSRTGLLPPASLTVEREVPGPLSVVDSAVRAWLSSQLFDQCRHHGDRTQWARREGMVASVRRTLDVNHRISLNGVRSLEFALAESPAGVGRVLVRLQADVRDQRNAAAWLFAGGAMAGAGAAGALLLVDPVTLVASIPGGAGVAFGGHLAGRSHYRREVGKIETALAGLLDRLEHRPSPPAPRATPTTLLER